MNKNVMDKYYLGLTSNVEKEINIALGYLNKTEKEKYTALLSELIRCAYDVQINKHLGKTHLDVFEEGMRQSKELIFYSYSGQYVNRLSHYFEEVRTLYKHLVNDKSNGIRFNAVTLMLGNPPENIISYVLGKCYNDKSSKVRNKVADVSLRLDLRQILPSLEQQYETECKEHVRKSLLFTIELLKNGYLLENCNDGKLSITVSNGRTGISGRLFEEKYLETYSIEDIVKSFRDNREFPWE